MKSIRRMGAVLLILSATTISSLQAADWIKYDQQVLVDGEVLAKYTTIQTKKTIVPYRVRVLYEDENGVLLVLRNEFVTDATGAVQSSAMSARIVGTGETLHISMPNTAEITLTIGGGSMTFADADVFPDGVRQSALQLLASNTSQAFRDALHRLAEVGSFYTVDHSSLAFALRGLFFPDISVTGPPQDRATTPTQTVKDFDPLTQQPRAFEATFGDAYYQ